MVFIGVLGICLGSVFSSSYAGYVDDVGIEEGREDGDVDLDLVLDVEYVLTVVP